MRDLPSLKKINKVCSLADFDETWPEYPSKVQVFYEIRYIFPVTSRHITTTGVSYNIQPEKILYQELIGISKKLYTLLSVLLHSDIVVSLDVRSNAKAGN